MDDSLMLRDIWAAVARQRWLVLAFAVLGLALAFTANTVQEPIYESTASILVKFGRETDGPDGGRPAISRDNAMLVNAELEILYSSDLILSVVEAVGPAKLYPTLVAPPSWLDRQMARITGEKRSPNRQLAAVAAMRFRNDYSVQAVPDASVLRVFYRHPDPNMAADVLRRLIAQFTDMHLEAFSDPQSTAFLETQVEDYRVELETLDRKLEDFRRENRLFSSDRPGQAVLGQRDALRQELGEVEGRISGLEEKLSYLDRELERARNASRYEGVDLVPTLEREIVSARASLEFERANERGVRRRLGRVNGELSVLPNQNKEYTDLVRERDAVADSYRTYSEKLREARISDAMDRQKIANIRVIQNPLAPLKPIRPRKAANMVIGLVAGLAIGSLLALVRDARRRADEEEEAPSGLEEVIRVEPSQNAS